ncbi:hypothetical protein ACWEXK_12300 [Staphylococcus xylosus]|uniref:hypothetical protein n=1 Tax=Staphylococcus xylosus TaxID=1288 RepID=UPI000D1F747B|nr:hypothetical protein [Staphylococcus xylosus]PTI18322.1 hypothetical protein BU115_12125 [Staphylococcus xylosus]
MLDVLLYIVMIIAIAFMVYQTHRFVRALKMANERGRKKDVYIFIAIITIIWIMYIGVVTYVLLNK